MNRLKVQCDCAKNFPLNTVNESHALGHDLYLSKLNEHGNRLFCSPESAILDFLEFGQDSDGGFGSTSASRMTDEMLDYWEPRVKNVLALRRHLGLDDQSPRVDPWIRFL